MLMPEIALAPDIRGVQGRGNLGDEFEPKEDRHHEQCDAQKEQARIDRHPITPARRSCFGWIVPSEQIRTPPMPLTWNSDPSGAPWITSSSSPIMSDPSLMMLKANVVRLLL